MVHFPANKYKNSVWSSYNLFVVNHEKTKLQSTIFLILNQSMPNHVWLAISAIIKYSISEQNIGLSCEMDKEKNKGTITES